MSWRYAANWRRRAGSFALVSRVVLANEGSALAWSISCCASS
jgi:hypothetical protein